MQAVFYDGVTADRHEVEVDVGRDSIRVAGADPVAFSELSVADEDKQYLVLSRKDHPGWRLIFDQPVDAELRARLPQPSR